MRVRVLLLSPILASLVLLTACATEQATRDKGHTGSTGGNAAAATAGSQPEKGDDDTEQDYPVRPFATQTLYELLVAEFAGVRGDLNTALDIYIDQALSTRDPNVIERAAQTASYLNDKAALESLSELWVEIDPDSSEAHKLAFYFRSRSGELEAAYTSALHLFEQGHGEALMSLPIFTEKSAAPLRARLLSEYTALEHSFPANRDILLGKIQLEGQQGDISASLKTGKKLLRLDPDNEYARLAIAQLLYKQNQREQAIKTLNQGIRLNPDSKKLQLQLIRFVADTDLAEAQKRMTQLAADHDDDFDLQYSLGLLNKQRGLRDEARDIFHKMINQNRRVADAHYQLAVMAEEENHLAEAMTHYLMVGEGNNLLPAAARMTQIMAANNQLNEARLYLHRLRLEQPKLTVPLYRMESELLMTMNHYESAHRLLSESLEQNPDNFDLLYTRSLVSEKLNDIVGMERDLRAILRQDANNASALNALGYSLANHTNRLDEALVFIRQALAISPNDAAIIDSLGWVLYRQGNTKEALVHLRQALATMPDPEVAAHLGEVLWMSGETEEATRIWRSALERDPDSKYLLDTLSRLKVKL